MTDPAFHLSLMEHAVGDHGHRNHFAAEPSGVDAERWELFVSLRLATRGQVLPGGLQLYYVSVAGVAALRAIYPRRYSRELKGTKLR